MLINFHCFCTFLFFCVLFKNCILTWSGFLKNMSNVWENFVFCQTNKFKIFFAWFLNDTVLSYTNLLSFKMFFFTWYINPYALLLSLLNKFWWKPFVFYLKECFAFLCWCILFQYKKYCKENKLVSDKNVKFFLFLYHSNIRHTK